MENPSMITTNPLTRAAQPGIQTIKETFVVRDSDRRPVTELLPALHLFHPNILIIGSDAETESALAQIRPSLLTPLDLWSPTEMPHLPASGFRSLIVRDIECLTTSQQQRLATLLNRSADDFQIVSIAGLPLFPLVRQGLFLEELYYRLNVVLLESSRNGSYGW
jgi:hypothetical protein